MSFYYIIDFSKAFDKVSHQLAPLSQANNYHGIRDSLLELWLLA